MQFDMSHWSRVFCWLCLPLAQPKDEKIMFNRLPQSLGVVQGGAVHLNPLIQTTPGIVSATFIALANVCARCVCGGGLLLLLT